MVTSSLLLLVILAIISALIQQVQGNGEARAIRKTNIVIEPKSFLKQKKDDTNGRYRPLRKMREFSRRYNPEVRRLVANLLHTLTKNGRGFALAVHSVQHVASSRLRRMKELKDQCLTRDAGNEFCISSEETKSALTQGLAILSSNGDVLKKDGWKAVHESDIFSLFKRKLPGRKGKGPVEYLMFGFLDQISPRTLMRTQVDREHRERWDRTLSSMETLQRGSSELCQGAEDSQDVQYYRCRWPWPLKDRDYTLSRRCLKSPDKRALVFVSKSISFPARPSVDKVIRVDKYRCFSVFLSSPSTPGKPDLDTLGVSYASVFCDDTKVALPGAVVDLISKHAEKIVPNSMNKLFSYCTNLQKNI